ncbi:MAG: hypothetical protein ABIQ27_08255 [Flavobacterium sp.]|uniref:hypothetical protein n=1 Tax=Flavobacterium sp. TaxID=239 RepID=UPI0032655A31
MKKIIFLFALATTLFSCTDNDDTIINDSVLQKVVFYDNSSNERQWNISNDLLTSITLADGSIAEEFTYDTQNRVILDTKYVDGNVSEVNTITYNTDNTINSINGLPYTFNATTRTYTYSYGSTFTINCVVNEDMLAVDFIRTGTGAGEYHMTYAGGNMASFEKTTSSSTDILKNFHFDGAYGVNPLRNAVLAVARVKSLTDPNFFIDCQASEGMPNGFDKGLTDTNYYNYGMVLGSGNYQIGVEILDSSNNYVDSYSFAAYYYQ